MQLGFCGFLKQLGSVTRDFNLLVYYFNLLVYIKYIIVFIEMHLTRDFEVESKWNSIFPLFGLSEQHKSYFFFLRLNSTEKLSLGNFLEEISFEKTSFRTKKIMPLLYFDQVEKR